MDVIAEGIETLEQMESLCKRGCTLMQGYLFSKPIRGQYFEDAVTAPDSEWRQPVASLAGWQSSQ
jgi:EAL domain-containing protein (putative c-di-GMP-specific phosphodiesterase class I)